MLEALGTRIEKEELLGKYKLHELNAACVEDWSPLTQRLLKALPYSLTPSQLNAVSEIIWDLKRPVPMNRLLQVLAWLFKFYLLCYMKLLLLAIFNSFLMDCD